MADDILIELTADIVSAHVSNNAVSPDALPGLIAGVFAALTATTRPAEPVVPKQEPAVPIKASVRTDYIVCLEDGKKLTMLKRYLRTVYGLSPAEYRAKWGLPSDYPMVAPSYAERRRDIAKASGLGRKAVENIETAVEAVVEPVIDLVKAGRKKLGIVAAKAAAAAHLGLAEPAAAKAPRRKAAAQS